MKRAVSKKTNNEKVNEFSNMEDVKSKKPALEKLVREWVELMDK